MSRIVELTETDKWIVANWGKIMNPAECTMHISESIKTSEFAKFVKDEDTKTVTALYEAMYAKWWDSSSRDYGGDQPRELYIRNADKMTADMMKTEAVVFARSIERFGDIPICEVYRKLLATYRETVYASHVDATTQTA